MMSVARLQQHSSKSTTASATSADHKKHRFQHQKRCHLLIASPVHLFRQNAVLEYTRPQSRNIRIYYLGEWWELCWTISMGRLCRYPGTHAINIPGIIILILRHHLKKIIIKTKKSEYFVLKIERVTYFPNSFITLVCFFNRLFQEIDVCNQLLTLQHFFRGMLCFFALPQNIPKTRGRPARETGGGEYTVTSSFSEQSGFGDDLDGIG